jgi:hypothetical protein
MRKTIRALVVMMTAAVILGGCDSAEEGKKDILPFTTLMPAAGSSAYLYSFEVVNYSISPVFVYDTTEYTLVVNKSEALTLTVKAIGPAGAAVTVGINDLTPGPVSETDYSATLTLDGSRDVNVIAVTATSEDGATTMTYTLRVYYKGTSSSPSGLAVSLTPGSLGGITSNLSPSFDPAVTDYTVGISYAVTSIDITLTLPDGSGITALVDGWTALSGSSVPITNLPAAGGSVSITVAVTSQDKSVTRNYTITFNKEGEPSHEARIDYLQLKGYSAAWYLVDVGATSTMLASNYMFAVTDANAYWRSRYRVFISPMDDSVSSMTAKVFTNNQDPDTGATPLNSGSFTADGIYWIYTFDKDVFSTSMYPLDVHIHIVPEDGDTANEKVYQLRINK